ncbi:MAG: hypothetical protein V4564_16515 [Pseudomonadota bacterium]|nr:hypothetical protein [Sphingomonas sp. ERG5]
MLLAKPSARVYQAASLRGDGTGWLRAIFLRDASPPFERVKKCKGK